MEFTRHLSLLALALFAVLALYGHSANACMCMPSHPQTHYCSADYGELSWECKRTVKDASILGEFNKINNIICLTVVQLRVLRKSNKIETGKTIYKVHIKRTYKVSSCFLVGRLVFSSYPVPKMHKGAITLWRCM